MIIKEDVIELITENAVPKIDQKQLKWYISELKKLYIPFNFVMNNLWSRGRERNEKGRALIKNEISKLIDIDIEGLILANPYLIRLVRNWFLDIKIAGSINLEISSLNMFKDSLNFCANNVVLGRDITRDFELLD